ncbi:hypothetical protein [Streptomyces niveus]|uniref:hypothetical protein n=1 Tax=Streptomyces niveus TaxID=193462 RepID=UPI0036AE3154
MRRPAADPCLMPDRTALPGPQAARRIDPLRAAPLIHVTRNHFAGVFPAGS